MLAHAGFPAPAAFAFGAFGLGDDAGRGLSIFVRDQFQLRDIDKFAQRFGVGLGDF